MTIYCYTDKKSSCEDLAGNICRSARSAIAERGKFSIVLSGGSTPVYLYRLLASPPWRDTLDWPNILIFFGDERCVRADHPDSNYKMAEDSLLSRVPVLGRNVFRIIGEQQPAVEAKRYEKEICTVLSGLGGEEPLFDIVLLGLGTDGHTASLFPEATSLHHPELVVSVDAPTHMEPSVERVSLTLRGIAMSRQVCFLVDGKSKTDIVKTVLQNRSQKFPASMVCGKTLSWYLSGMDCSLFSN